MTIDISGKVVHGKHFGTALGFPTANLDRREYSRRKLKIRLGVWAGEVKLKVTRSRSSGQESGKWKVFKAGIVIGPIDNHRLPRIEAHLIGFKGGLYGKKITVILKKYLRPFKKYDSMAKLKSAIKKDITKIKKMQYE